MKEPTDEIIDPLVDPVFKALFGTEDNKNLLINFLNSVLPDRHIVEVDIIDPHTLRHTLDDKLTIVDVKARDQDGGVSQIEVQGSLHTGFTRRMLYTWSSLLSDQLRSGQAYSELQPVVAIWVLRGVLFPEVEGLHTHLRMGDPDKGVYIVEESGIHVLELTKQREDIPPGLDRWVRFFTEAMTLQTRGLPPELDHPEMRQAMSTVRRFTEDEIERARYNKALREQLYETSLLKDREDALRRLEQAKEQAKAEIAKAREQAEAAKNQAEAAKNQAEAAKNQAEAAKNQAEAAKNEVEAAKNQAEAAKNQALAAMERAHALERENERLRRALESSSEDP